MSGTARGVGPLSWRVRAYEGEYRQRGADLPLVGETSGKITEESSMSIELDMAQRCLLSAAVNLNNRRMAAYPLPSFAPIGDFITIGVEELASDEATAGHLIARLDLMREADCVHGSLLVENQPRIDLEPVKIGPSDGVLDVFLRLLLFMLH